MLVSDYKARFHNLYVLVQYPYGASGYFFGCHDMSQVIDIEPVEGITNAPQSQ